MQRTGFAPLSSTIRVLAVVISAWSVGPAVAQEEQEAGESKPTYITFTLPPNQGTDLFFVNGSLTVAGTYYKATGGQAAFVSDSRGTITPINPPGSTATVVTGLSQDGTIVGWYAQGGATHGFVRDPFGSITTFDVGLPTFLYGINAAGSFIGATTGQAFVRDANGILTMFNVPGSNGTVPSSINQAGEITGL